MRIVTLMFIAIVMLGCLNPSVPAADPVSAPAPMAIPHDYSTHPHPHPADKYTPDGFVSRSKYGTHSHPTPTPALAVPLPTPTVRPPLVLPATVKELVIWAEDSIVEVKAGRSGGSGFIFDTEGDTAFIVTNHHVIEDADTYEVTVHNSDRYKAILLGYSSDKDIAVLSICCSSEFFAILWDSGAEATLHDDVVAIGFPRGSQGRVIATTGVMRDNWLGNALSLASHDAPLNPGNSGPPLLSMNGEVLGVNVASSTLEEGIFYAVPYSEISKEVSAWKSRLVMLPTSTPVILDHADMWVKLETEESGSLNVDVDVSFDVQNRRELTVFVDSQECFNLDRMYGDEGDYYLYCWGHDAKHSDVRQVSAQSIRGDLRCTLSPSSNAERTLFACTWR